MINLLVKLPSWAHESPQRWLGVKELQVERWQTILSEIEEILSDVLRIRDAHEELPEEMATSIRATIKRAERNHRKCREGLYRAMESLQLTQVLCKLNKILRKKAYFQYFPKYLQATYRQLYFGADYLSRLDE